MRTSQIILTHTNILKTTLDNDIYTLLNGRKTVVIIHIYEARASSYHLMMIKTLNLSNMKYKRANIK